MNQKILFGVVGLLVGIVSVFLFQRFQNSISIFPVSTTTEPAGVYIEGACEYKSGLLRTVANGFSVNKNCGRAGRYVKFLATSGNTNSDPSPVTDGLSADDFYIRSTSVAIDARVGVASTTYISCDGGDIAISGGLNSVSGNISNWRTIKSNPGNPQNDNPNSWEITVINEIEDGTFWPTVKCMRIAR